MRQGIVAALGGEFRTTDVTIRPVDGGFIVEWTEVREREIPPGALGTQEESWKMQGRKMNSRIVCRGVVADPVQRIFPLASMDTSPETMAAMWLPPLIWCPQMSNLRTQPSLRYYRDA